MCGIAGLVRPGIAAEPNDEAAVGTMLARLAHRGPDEQLVLKCGDATLGTARLALVDRPTSQQPMRDDSGLRLLSFNGEIYNFRELRRELTAAGIRFRTSGDTEVLLQWLIHRGADGLRELRGQFALAFWDSDRRELVLARDRFGIVPLYYHVARDGTVAFASEVKALRALGAAGGVAVSDLVDTAVLWGLHPGRSMFADVSSVPPGTFVRVQRGQVGLHPYWDFDLSDTRESGSLAEQGEHLASLLTAAVERRVPHYGDPAVLVSGGLDSTAVLALLRAARPAAPIRSYSIGFTERALDESTFQRLASTTFGTDHTEIVCDPETVAETLRHAVIHAEAPLIRTAPASSIRLAQAIEARGTRAVLSGEGADELLCGYDVFKVARIRDEWSRDPESDQWPLLLDAALEKQRGMGRTVGRTYFERGLDRRDDAVFSHLTRWQNAFKVTQYLQPSLRRGLDVENVIDGVRARLPDRYHGWSRVEQAQYLEVTYFLASSLLASQCDRPFMAHSIEARYPFLDEDVVDFALALPESSKLDGLTEKAVLKSAMSSSVPDTITNRVKQPYTAPEGDVFRSPAGMALVDEYLSASALETVGLFDTRKVTWLTNKVTRSPTSFHEDLALLWILSSQILANEFGVADN